MWPGFSQLFSRLYILIYNIKWKKRRKYTLDQGSFTTFFKSLFNPCFFNFYELNFKSNPFQPSSYTTVIIKGWIRSSNRKPTLHTGLVMTNIGIIFNICFVSSTCVIVHSFHEFFVPVLITTLLKNLHKSSIIFSIKNQNSTKNFNLYLKSKIFRVYNIF